MFDSKNNLEHNIYKTILYVNTLGRNPLKNPPIQHFSPEGPNCGIILKNWDTKIISKSQKKVITSKNILPQIQG